MSKTVGIIGGGQLGRMLAMAAAKIGVRPHIFAPEPAPCAADVAQFTQAQYDDERALQEWARACDAITFEFENIPTRHLDVLSDKLRPHHYALEVSQNRVREKEFLRNLDVPLAGFFPVKSRDDLQQAANKLQYPIVLKSAELGYDGKGQYVLSSSKDIDEALTVAGDDAVAEAWVPFVGEFSIIAVFGQHNNVVFYDACENIHRKQMLAHTRLPASLNQATEALAQNYVASIGNALGYVGTLTVEFFMLEDQSILANEIAPRVHNSGHWTIEGAYTSQFENHIRAVMGMPLGSTKRLGNIFMENIVGLDMQNYRENLPQEGSFHDYGKNPPKAGRKMGHLTKILPF
jgi:5-(carboxyamino)imidazole ribonucleotide synthase